MTILEQEMAPQRPWFSPFSLGIRIQTGLIFFVGLLLLITATIIITLAISRTISQDAATLARLQQMRTELLELNQAVLSEANPSLVRPDFEQALAGLAPEVQEPKIRQSLELAMLTWPQFMAAVDTLIQRPNDPLTRRQLLGHYHTLVNALAQAEATVQTRQAATMGMVRGMYAALFLSSLVFLLVGLWSIEQIVVAPVEILHQIANRMASGDLDTPVTLGGRGEFRTLTHNFELMRQHLQQSRQQLLRWADSLQSHVARRTQQLSALSQVVATASQSLDLDEVVRTALEQSLQVMGVEIGGLWLIDPESGDLRLASAYGMSNTMQEQLGTLKVGEGYTGGAAQTGETITLEDISQMPPQGVRVVAIQAGVRSLAVVPIKIRERVLGVLDVMTRQRRQFAPEEVALLTSIGQQIGIAVDSLRLMQQTHQQAQQVATLQERERIGAELHDGLLQTLGYVYLNVDQLEVQATKRGLDEMAQQLTHLDTVLDQAAREVRRYVAELRQSRPTPAVSLQGALQQMLSEFSRENTLNVTLETEGPPLLLPAEQSSHLSRIAREALVNAARHGRAQRAIISCARRGKSGELQIQDDGVGFTPGQTPDDGRRHFGLSIMQARAQHLQGQLIIDSAPGRGARITVVWPLKDKT